MSSYVDEWVRGGITQCANAQGRGRQAALEDGLLGGINTLMKIIGVKPPYLLAQLGLIRSTDRWKLKRALYGLQMSPRDWSEHRDKELRTIRFTSLGGAKLQEGIIDESLRFIKSEGGMILGIMIIYVDEKALSAPEEVANSLVDGIGTKTGSCRIPHGPPFREQLSSVGWS